MSLPSYGLLEVFFHDPYHILLSSYLNYSGPHAIGLFAPSSLFLHYALYNAPLPLPCNTFEELMQCPQVRQIQIYSLPPPPLPQTSATTFPTSENLITIYHEIKKKYLPQPLSEVLSNLLHERDVFSGYDMLNLVLAQALNWPTDNLLSSRSFLLIPHYTPLQKIAIGSSSSQYSLDTDRNAVKIFFTVLQHEFLQNMLPRLLVHSAPVKLLQLEEDFIRWLLQSIHQGKLSIAILNEYIRQFNLERQASNVSTLPSCFNYASTVQIYQEVEVYNCSVPSNRCNYLQDLGQVISSALNMICQQGVIQLTEVVLAYNRCVDGTDIQRIIIPTELLTSSREVKVAAAIHGNVEFLTMGSGNLQEFSREKLLDFLLYIESRRDINNDQEHMYRYVQNMINYELAKRYE